MWQKKQKWKERQYVKGNRNGGDNLYAFEGPSPPIILHYRIGPMTLWSKNGVVTHKFNIRALQLFSEIDVSLLHGNAEYVEILFDMARETLKRNWNDEPEGHAHYTYWYTQEHCNKYLNVLC